MKITNWYTNALGFAAMICGGLALLLSFLPSTSIGAWALAPIAIILGAVSLRAEQRGPSIVGLALGFSALIVCIIWIAVLSSRTDEKALLAKQKATESLDGALVTMSKRDPGPAPQIATTVDPVTTRDEVPTGTTSAFDPPKADAPPTAITLGEYTAIENGMTYERVAYLVGSPGTMTTDMNSGAMSVRSYEWAGADAGTVVRVQFQNNKVITKMQTGLQ